MRNICLTHQEIEINDTIQSKDAAKSTSFISYGKYYGGQIKNSLRS